MRPRRLRRGARGSRRRGPRDHRLARRQRLRRVLRRHHAVRAARLPRRRAASARCIRRRWRCACSTRRRCASTTAGLFVTPATIAAAKAASRKRGVVQGTDLARMFAWMRPNDLVWNYVVNNYLLGNEPPAHDILFWNNDSTRLPARLHADFLDLFEVQSVFRAPASCACAAGRSTSAKVGIDTYVVGGPHRSHHDVAGRLPDRAAVRQRAQHVRPRERRPHPEPRQSAGEQAIVVRRRRRRARQRPKPGSRGGRRPKAPGGRTGASGSARAPAR